MVIPFGDGFHTASPGGLFMAHAILTGLGAPAKVSDVKIALKPGDQQAIPERCKVENLRMADGGVAFDRTDEAIPIPIQKDWVSLLPYVNELKDLNYYGLTVTGLPPGTYSISIDEKEVTKATADDLAKDINVGNVAAGPVWEQGQKVFEAINAKNRIVHGRFRGVVMFQPPDWLADVANERKALELGKRMAQINERQAEIYKQVQPKTHKWSVARQ
jgi:hypothetical protein